MYLQKNGPSDWRVKLDIPIDSIHIYGPYNDEPTINGGLDLAVALGIAEEDLQEDLECDLGDIHDFISSAKQVLGKQAAIAGYPVFE